MLSALFRRVDSRLTRWPLRQLATLTDKTALSPPQQHQQQSPSQRKRALPPWMKRLKTAVDAHDVNTCLAVLQEQLNHQAASGTTNYYITMGITRALEKLPPSHALQVWNLVKSRDLAPTTLLCVTIVKLLIKLGMVRHVEGTITGMLAAGMKPHWAPFFYWADAYAEAGDAAGVASVARAAHQHGIHVSDHYHTLLVKALCKDGRRAESLKLLDRLQQAGITPSEPTWRALIHCHGVAGHVSHAEEIFRRMRAAGIVPGVETWSALLNAFSECRMPEQARKVVDEMRAAGQKPNPQTYTALIKAFAQEGNADAALAALDDMKADGLVPNMYIWTVVSGACASAGNPDAVRKLMKEMEATGHKPGSQEWATLFSSYRISGDLAACKGLLEEMEVAGIPLTLRVYTEIVLLLGEHGLPMAALSAFEEMKARGIEPDWLFYNIIVAALMQNWVVQDCRDPDSPLLLKARDLINEGLYSGALKLPRELNHEGKLVRIDLHNYGTWAVQLVILDVFKELAETAHSGGNVPALMFITGQGRKKGRAPMREVVLRMLRKMMPVRVSSANEGTLIVAAKDVFAFAKWLGGCKQDVLEAFTEALIDPGEVVRDLNHYRGGNRNASRSYGDDIEDRMNEE